MADKNSKELIQWQRRLLPVMIVAISLTGGFFFVVSLLQLVRIEREIQGQPLPTLKNLDLIKVDAAASAADQLAVHRFRAEADLEVQLVAQRYNMARVFLISRVYTNYMGFVTGMILAVVGSVFVLGKMREPATEASADWAGNKGGLKSESPGIILAVLGTALMLLTIHTNHRIDVTDAAIYLHGPVALPASTLPPKIDDPYSKPPTK